MLQVGDDEAGLLPGPRRQSKLVSKIQERPLRPGGGAHIDPNHCPESAAVSRRILFDRIYHHSRLTTSMSKL